MLYSVFTRPWTCYTWHVTSDTDTWHVILDIWFMTPALGIYTGTQYLHRHLICYTWYLIPLDIRHRYLIYLTPAPDTRYMTCFHVIQTHWLDIVTLDRTLPPLIPILYDIFMTITLRGVDMVIILLLLSDIWYSWTPILLYTWTPEIGRLLTLLLILYSSWPR